MLASVKRASLLSLSINYTSKKVFKIGDRTLIDVQTSSMAR